MGVNVRKVPGATTKSTRTKRPRKIVTEYAGGFEM